MCHHTGGSEKSSAPVTGPGGTTGNIMLQLAYRSAAGGCGGGGFTVNSLLEITVKCVILQYDWNESG